MSERKTRGPRPALSGSREAKQKAAVILEVLSGLRTPAEGSTALSISQGRYYQLETNALQGMISGLELRPRGKQKSDAVRIRELERDKERLEREVARGLSLVRAAQRSVGIPAIPKRSAKSKGAAAAETTSGKKRRKTKPRVRAAKAIRVLRKVDDATPAAAEPSAAQLQ